MDKSEFHALYERYSHDVYRFAYYLSGTSAQAEDVASETFVRAWTACDGMRTSRSWMRTPISRGS
jgi:RNA polymerase sigma-70 factor (ECF subfamily)